MASESAKQAIFVKSEPYEGIKISGPDFNAELSLAELLESYSTIGFQANSLARAVEIINKMVSPSFRIVADVPSTEDEFVSFFRTAVVSLRARRPPSHRRAMID